MKRFWSKVKKTKGCWIWTAGRSADGYGQFRIGNKKKRAHRVSYELCVGEIPDEMWVLHRCDNPLCVNPNHLFLGDNKSNQEDMTKKGRGRFGNRNGRTKLTDNQVKEIRLQFQAGSTQRRLAKQYGVHHATIYKIVNQLTRKSDGNYQKDTSPEKDR